MLELCNAFQAESPPTFDGFIRLFKRFPTAIIDIDGVFQRQAGQAYEPLESKGIEAGIVDKQVFRMVRRRPLGNLRSHLGPRSFGGKTGGRADRFWNATQSHIGPFRYAAAPNSRQFIHSI
jgi:hypothetical protein